MPPKYIQEECFMRITNMSQKYKISRNELLEMKVHRPYASKTTYHFNKGTYDMTEGHHMFQPLKCTNKVDSLYLRSLKYILINNSFTEDIYEEQSSSIDDYIRPTRYKYTVQIYEGRKPHYKFMTLEIEWRVGIDIQKIISEQKGCPETGHFLGIQGHTILKKNLNLGWVRLLEQDSTLTLPTALLADQRAPHNMITPADENMLVQATDP